jgi:hypothetical protein
MSVPPAVKVATATANLNTFWLKDESLEDSNESDVSDQKPGVSQFLERPPQAELAQLKFTLCPRWFTASLAVLP